MNLSPKSLYGLTAADLMTTNLVLLPQEMSLVCAARIMSRAGVSGAPVVNAEGQLVGVFSATDYMLTWDRVNRNANSKDPGCMAKAWAIPESSGLEGESTVMDFMSKNPVTVSPSASIAELAQMMLEAHIHRVVVTEANGRPRGIVTTMDLLAAISKFAPEADSPARGPKARFMPFARVAEYA